MAEWRTVRLKYLSGIPITTGVGLPAEHQNPEWPRYIRTTDIQSPQSLRDDVFYSQPPDLLSVAGVERNDLLLTAAGTVGQSYMHMSDEPAVYAGYLARFRPGPDVDPRFVSYWAQSADYWRQIEVGAVRSTIDNFSAGRYRNMHLRLPSLDVQSRVADFLDRETQRIDQAQAAIARLLDVMTERRREALGRRLSSESCASRRPIWSCISLNPETLSEDTDPDLVFPYIDISTVSEAEMLTPQEVRFSTAPSRARRVVRTGDVIVSTVRTYLRAVAAVPESLDGAVASTGFAVLRPRPSLLDGRYLRYWCMTEEFLSDVIARSYGVSYPAINASDLVRLKMPLPTIAEQLSIVEELEEEEADSRRREDSLRALDELLRQRRQALVTAAVTGQLDVEAMV